MDGMGYSRLYEIIQNPPSPNFPLPNISSSLSIPLIPPRFRRSRRILQISHDTFQPYLTTLNS